MTLHLGGSLPSNQLAAEFGLPKTERLERVFGQIMEIETEDVEAVLREVRRMVYTIGLRGGYEEIQADALVCVGEQIRMDILLDKSPVEEGTDQFRTLLKRWRSYLALRALSVLKWESQFKIIGDIDARLRDTDNHEKALSHFNKDGKLNVSITGETPLDILMDIIALAEEFEGQESIPQNISPSLLERARLAALEKLTEQLITVDPSMKEMGMKYLRLKHFREILKSVPGALGEGRIGGKAAGMLIAYAVLEKETPEFDKQFEATHDMGGGELKRYIDIDGSLQQNTSYFLGSNILSEIITQREMRDSGCTTFKYDFYGKDGSSDEQAEEHEKTKQKLFETELPEHLKRQLRDLFGKLHGTPCIVRSSSELEDRFGAAFAGKYDSVYLANSKDFDSDFEKFLMAIKQVHVSVFSPNVMRYRAKRGLIPYDEEMGLLIQSLNGEEYGDFYYPFISGVAMSKATESWGPDPERGAMRVAVGLGETVVDGSALVVMFEKPASNPNLGRKKGGTQRSIAVIDKNAGERRFITITELMERMPFDKMAQFQEIISREENDGRYVSFSMLEPENDVPNMAITFKSLLNQGGKFNSLTIMIEYIVQKLKYVFGCNVDVEFTLSFDKASRKYLIKVVQCRPQNIPDDMRDYKCPALIAEENIILKTTNSLSCGQKQDIKYIVYVPPDFYKGDKSVVNKLNIEEVKEMRRWVCALNTKLGKGNFLLVAPGRLGSNDVDQGIPIDFSEFLNAAGFVELTGRDYGAAEPSFGTHFYQEVVEAGMTKYAVSLETDDGNQDICNRAFLDQAASVTGEFIPDIPGRIGNWLRVIDVSKTWSQHIGEPESKRKDWRLHIAQTNRAADGGVREGVAYIAEQGKNTPELIAA